jgi:tight adherence protein C
MSSVYLAIMLGIILVYMIVNNSVKKRYSEEIEPLNQKDYSFKQLLPFGLWLYDELKIPSSGAYHVFLFQRVVMVYGTRYAQYYLRIHWAEKFLYFFLGIVAASFIGSVSESSLRFLPILFAVGIILFFLTDKTLDDKANRRKLQFMMDFPVFISKLTLLMNAGMHLRQALMRIYNDSTKKSPIYVELGTVLEDIESGIGENQAWMEFSERCKVKEITSFASMMMQNTKIGGNQLVEELKRMTHETWEMRKHAAKQMSETASAKLIFPLMLMFLAILLIVIMPAIMQLSNGF